MLKLLRLTIPTVLFLFFGLRTPAPATASPLVRFPSVRLALARGLDVVNTQRSALVRRLKRRLDPTRGPGYVLLDLRAALPRDQIACIYDRLPRPGEVMFGATSRLLAGDAEELLDETDGTAFAPLEQWVTGLLHEALNVRFATTVHSLRMGATSEPGAATFPSFHVDGGHIVGLLGMVGTGPGILPGAPRMDHHSPAAEWARLRMETRSFRVPEGYLILFSGTQRAATHPTVFPTVHRTEISDAPRLLWLLRLDEVRD